CTSMAERLIGFDHRDPTLLPFVEVEAKVVREVIAEAREAGASAKEIVAAIADTATTDAETGASVMSERLAGGKRLPLACSAGCSYCCHSTVHASAPEILRIASWLKEKREEDDLAVLRARAEGAAEAIAPLNLSERLQAKIPCPLLDAATGACTVY